jgi:hypothetical protein
MRRMSAVSQLYPQVSRRAAPRIALLLQYPAASHPAHTRRKSIRWSELGERGIQRRPQLVVSSAVVKGGEGTWGGDVRAVFASVHFRTGASRHRVAAACEPGRSAGLNPTLA